ncbi:MAG TPA: TrkA family potassium uptake protein [Candidatus Paceibacterota bacterium]|nr:TrkA family potassium uptake protein [Verrucomicrobiota bacterium]HSA12484.1 TrkA family potassium uptake protein [Candidatus Paceibacterota bacterium]
MICAVIGLGDFGRAAAIGLARAGAEVIAVDRNMDRLKLVQDEVALAVRMDATHRDALEAQGLAKADVLIAAIGQNFEAQVLVVVHAKRLGVKRVVARAVTEEHRRVLEAVGADEVFNPEEQAAHSMAQRLTISNIRNYFELADGFSVVEVKAPPEVVGRALRDLDLRQRFRVNLLAIKRMGPGPKGTQPITEFKAVPMPEDIIQADDILALSGSVLDLARFVGDNS